MKTLKSGLVKQSGTIKKWSMLSPAMIVVTVAFFIPLIMLFALSLYRGIAGTGFVDKTELTLANFAKIFTPYYARVLWRTFRIAVFSALLSLVFGYPIAMAMARGSNRLKNILLIIILTPLMTNVTARTLGLMIIFAESGPVNNVIAALGFDRVRFVGSEIGVVLGLTQVFIPYMILSIKSVLENINFNLEEAARDLGCSRVTAFFRVVFPLSMPGIVAGSLFVFLLSFSSFVTPQLLGAGKVMTVTMLIYQQSMVILDLPFAAASALVLLVFSLVLITIYNRMTSRIEKMSSKSGAYREVRFNTPWRRFTRTVRDCFYNVTAAVVRNVRSKREQTEKIKIAKRSRPFKIGKVSFVLVVCLVSLFIVLPLFIVVLSAFSADRMFIKFPPSGLSLQWFENVFSQPEYMNSFWLSLRIAVISTLISLVIGTLASLGLTRYRFRSTNFLKTIFLSPLMLPAVIVGVALMRFSATLGWVGDNKSLLLAHIMVTTAYVIRTVLSSLVGFDTSLEEAARDLGASGLYTFRKITLPIIKPGIVVAGIFSFIVSMDETTISRFIVRGGNMTLPVRIFAQLEYGVDLTVTAVSCLLIAFSLIAIVLIDRAVGINKFKI